MGVNGKFDDITRDDLMAVAKRFGVVGARDALSQVRDAVAKWSDFADEAGLPASTSLTIAADTPPAIGNATGAHRPAGLTHAPGQARKRVGLGKSVSVIVNLGGR